MSERDPMRWMWRSVARGALVLGWIFILWQNNFHITPAVVIIGLGYLAVVATVANLWRVGASAVAPEDNSADAWTRPIGAKGELEREKKTLLKAIKEAEFDHAMGKLSKADADELIRMYRTRAIEVIKELEAMQAGAAASPREQIKREVQARLAVDQGKSNKKDRRGKKPASKPVDKPVEDKPVDDKPVETDPIKTPDVETNPVKTPADDDSPEDKVAEAAATTSDETANSKEATS
jgi:hypothetical protein